MVVSVGGVTPVGAGAAAGVTERDRPALEPTLVATVTIREPGDASAAAESVAVNDVGLITFTALAVTPPPLTPTVVELAMKLFPVIVTVTVDPAAIVAGEIAVSVGLDEDAPEIALRLSVQAGRRATVASIQSSRTLERSDPMLTSVMVPQLTNVSQARAAE